MVQGNMFVVIAKITFGKVLLCAMKGTHKVSIANRTVIVLWVRVRCRENLPADLLVYSTLGTHAFNCCEG